MQKRRLELVGHEVVRTIADGLCLIHSMALELRIPSVSFVWDVVAALLCHLGGRVDVWQDVVDDEFVKERLANLRARGI